MLCRRVFVRPRCGKQPAYRKCLGFFLFRSLTQSSMSSLARLLQSQTSHQPLAGRFLTAMLTVPHKISAQFAQIPMHLANTCSKVEQSAQSCDCLKTYALFLDFAPQVR